MPTTYANDSIITGIAPAEFNKRGGMGWAIPYNGTVKWCSATADLADMGVLAFVVYRLGVPVAVWFLNVSMAPLPASASNAASGLSDFDFAAYEPTGTLTVIPGDEIRMDMRNQSAAVANTDINLAICVGINWTDNNGGITVQSGPIPYEPK